MKSRTSTCLFCTASLLLFFNLISVAEEQRPELNREFFKVLRQGDAVALKQALDHGAALNARDEGGNTPLLHAAVYGDARSIALLLERGADVNATNQQGATALMRAAYSPDKLKLLLKHGANVNSRSVLGNTALMLAARPADSHQAVELLLNAGADAKATNNWGATALMAAAAGNDANSVRLLLKAGANPNAQPTADQLGFIIGGGRTPLMWAAFRGNTQIMQMLLEAGAKVNIPAALGTPLAQAVWSGQSEAVSFLLEHGANVNMTGPIDGYAALHWAASSEEPDASMVNVLLAQGADPNLGGGEHVDAFMGTVQTPLMLARRRGDTAVLAALVKAGATNATPDRVLVQRQAHIPDHLDSAQVRAAIAQALPPLQRTSIESKKTFLRHQSHQDCISCHQQLLPMAAIGLAKKDSVPLDLDAERELLTMVKEGEVKGADLDWEPLFHPEPVFSKGYSLLAFESEDLGWTEKTDSWVHHLAAIQGRQGQWHLNMPRPPIQTDDIGATALAVHALQRYPLPGRRAEFAERVQRAKQWLWNAKPQQTEGRVYQILGLAWAGEPAAKLQPLANGLLAEQRADGGWAQLPKLGSDAYATGQAIYALRVGAGLDRSHRAIDRGLRYLVGTQLDDGTWHVQRRTFPFQPTMNSGFPHGRDSWISATATSWAVMALSLPEQTEHVALSR